MSMSTDPSYFFFPSMNLPTTLNRTQWLCWGWAEWSDSGNGVRVDLDSLPPALAPDDEISDYYLLFTKHVFYGKHCV